MSGMDVVVIVSVIGFHRIGIASAATSRGHTRQILGNSVPARLAVCHHRYGSACNQPHMLVSVLIDFGFASV